MWRDSGDKLKMLGIDGRAMFLLLLVTYRPRVWTLVVAVLGIVALILMERKGYDIPNSMRRLRILVTGPEKLAVVGKRFNKMD